MQRHLIETRTKKLAILLVIILAVAASLLFYWQETTTPKFRFQLTLKAISPTSDEGQNDQHGSLLQDKTNSLNFTILTNSTYVLHGFGFSNEGKTALHYIALSIEDVPEGLLFGYYIQNNKLTFMQFNSTNLPLTVLDCNGTLNSSHSAMNSNSIFITTSAQGQYQILCRITSQEISFPFHITINSVA